MVRKRHFHVFRCALHFAGLIHVSPCLFFFLSVKARTAQLAKIKWFISVAFYVLQVSVAWALHSCDLSPGLLVYVHMGVGIFLCVLVHMCTQRPEVAVVSFLIALVSIFCPKPGSFRKGKTCCLLISFLRPLCGL